MNKTGFLEKSPGNFSSNRAAFMLIIVVSLFLTVMMVFKDKPIVDVVTLYGTMTATAITLKSLSKGLENKEPQDVPQNT
jgi:hypothetical protein